MKRWFAGLVCLLLAGCSTGFNRAAVQQRLEGQALEINDAEIRAELGKKPQVRFPMRVAVYMTADAMHRSRYGSYRDNSEPWRWTMDDKEKLDALAEPLREAGIVSDLFVMSDMIVAGTDLRNLRLAAAKHGADALLVIKGVTQVDNYVDAGAVLNLLIVPGFIVPSSHRDALFMMRGAMWDVGNEYLYLSVDSEGEAHTRAPTFRVDDKKAVEEAKLEALHGFGPELVKRLKGLKG
jgi:hypothetical protein